MILLANLFLEHYFPVAVQKTPIPTQTRGLTLFPRAREASPETGYFKHQPLKLTLFIPYAREASPPGWQGTRALAAEEHMALEATYSE